MANINQTLQSLYNSNMQSSIETGLATVDKSHIANTPISCNLLQQNSSKIIISEELIEKLTYIKSTIDRQKNTGKMEELPFAMLGHKDESGRVIITDIIYESAQFEQRLSNAQPGSLDTASAVFNENLSQAMSNHLQQKNISHPVVIHGHTHPQHLGVSSNLTNNFSLADMNAYQQFQENTQRVNPNAEVMGMVVNEIGDFNVVNYNSSNNTFERASSVQVGDTLLPSFSDGHYLSDTPPSLGNARQSIYNQLVNQTNPNRTTLDVSPKVEKVTLQEIIDTGYQPSTPYKPKKETLPKKQGFFSKLKNFIGQVFSCDESKYIDESIRTSKSIVKTDFKKKLEALKMQDKNKGISFE